jgi:hypothetical protein
MGGILREFGRQSTIARTGMRAILLLNGNRLIPAEAEDPDREHAASDQVYLRSIGKLPGEDRKK